MRTRIGTILIAVVALAVGAAAAVAAAQTAWRFEATDGDGKQGADAAAVAGDEFIVDYVRVYDLVR